MNVELADPAPRCFDLTAFFTKVGRALSVSVLTTGLSNTLLILLTAMVGMGASLANVVAVSAGIGPSYVLNRRWVWKRQGPHSAAREVVPFISLSVAGLVLSTLAVGKVAEIGQAWSGPARTLALPMANIGAFGAVWVVQFLLLDLVLFSERRAIPHDTLRDTRTEGRPQELVS